MFLLLLVLLFVYMFIRETSLYLPFLWLFACFFSFFLPTLSLSLSHRNTADRRGVEPLGVLLERQLRVRPGDARREGVHVHGRRRPLRLHDVLLLALGRRLPRRGGGHGSTDRKSGDGSGSSFGVRGERTYRAVRPE